MEPLIYLGNNEQGGKVAIRQSYLNTHVSIVGMTGSGKTGLLIAVLENLITNKVPMVVVDIKGDMPNLLLQKDSTVLQAVEARYLTPGSNHGESINVINALNNPDNITNAVTALLKLIGEKKVDPIQSKPHTYISHILQFRHTKGHDCSLDRIISDVQDPPFNKIGSMRVDEILSARHRTALAARLNNVLVAPSFEYWRTGIDLDFDTLLHPESGKVPVILYSVSHLVDDDERLFALSFLLDELVSWGRKQQGTQGLNVALSIDECYGLIPPIAKPSTKDSILTLLKQGRAQGIGVILSTQNPMDIDYKAVANCQTWLIGTLQTRNDRRRVVDAVAVSGARYDKNALDGLVGSLKPRQFLVAVNGNTELVYTKTTGANLVGPMSTHEVDKLYQSGVIHRPHKDTFMDKVRSIFN